jgi:Helix-turn-helix domain
MNEGSKLILADYLDRPEAAREFKVQPRTFSEWANDPDGGIPHVKIGRKLYFRRGDIVEWLERKRQQRNKRRRGRAQ